MDESTEQGGAYGQNPPSRHPAILPSQFFTNPISHHFLLHGCLWQCLFMDFSLLLIISCMMYLFENGPDSDDGDEHNFGGVMRSSPPARTPSYIHRGLRLRTTPMAIPCPTPTQSLAH